MIDDKTAPISNIELTPKSVGVNIFIKSVKHYRLIISLLTNSRRH